MGNSSWSSDAYSRLSSSIRSKPTASVFTSRSIVDEMSPVGIKFRESRDSVANPDSLAIGIGLDVTGSMDKIPAILVKEKLGKLVETLQAHGIPHPAILFMAIGDHKSDDAPLQVGQFESGTEELAKWLTSAWLEGGGGGGGRESYSLAHLIAGRHTSIDCYEKRNIKGFLFTIGDESPWETLEADRLKNIMGYSENEDLTAEQLIIEAKRMYHVFHIHVNEGSYRDDRTVINSWKTLLGEGLIILDDYNATAEVIASTVAMIHGADLKDITKTFDKKIATSVSNALVNIKSTPAKAGAKGIVAL